MPSPASVMRNSDDVLDVWVVGCGEPKKSMGWFHFTQLVADARVRVTAVVEPFLLGAGAGTAAAAAFAELRAAHPKIAFAATVAELPPRAANTPLLALIAGRTCDAPKLFADVLAAGATHVYLEKPGATDADTLDALRADAERRGVGVVVGYNKNVAKYARLALAELRGRAVAGRPTPRVVLQHCNDFEEGEPLAAFLRGPGGEGMLHNMCCHELALAVSRFGLSCARVAAVVLDPEKSAVVALDDGGSFDWQRVAFRLELRPLAAPASGDDAAATALASLSFEADRCAGNYSQLRLEEEGGATAAFRLPDLAQEKEIAAARAADAEMRPYFYQQGADYEALKGAFVDHILAGRPGAPAGVVGAADAVEVLRLADMLKPALLECWRNGAPHRVEFAP